MKTLTFTVMAVGWFSVATAFADSASESALRTETFELAETEKFSTADSPGDPASVIVLGTEQDPLWHERNPLRPFQDAGGADIIGSLQVPRMGNFSARYQIAPKQEPVVPSPGTIAEPALGPPASAMKYYAGLDNPDRRSASHWLDASHRVSSVFTLGYAWRNLHLEGSAFSGAALDEQRLPARESLKLDSRSARLTFRPSPAWSIQFSRGFLSGLDQVVAGGDVRRTALSSTYRRRFDGGDWETMVAWGRNSRQQRETTYGYIAESTLRFSGTHIFFGRVERVGSDELLRENESLQREAFKMNKVTVGYFQDIQANRALGLDVGMLVSRYAIPSHVAPSYGDNPMTYMVFVRMKLK